MWSEYRRIKLRLLVLLLGWIPFGVLLGAGLPKIFHSYTPSYVLAAVYVVLMAYTFLQFGLYPCPNCGMSFKCWQLFGQSCPNCGLAINRERPK